MHMMLPPVIWRDESKGPFTFYLSSSMAPNAFLHMGLELIQTFDFFLFSSTFESENESVASAPSQHQLRICLNLLLSG